MCICCYVSVPACMDTRGWMRVCGQTVEPEKNLDSALWASEVLSTHLEYGQMLFRKVDVRTNDPYKLLGGHRNVCLVR